MNNLKEAKSGLYAVTTRTAWHVIDLDRMTVVRQHYAHDGRYLRGDGVENQILEVVDCTLGRPLTLLLRLAGDAEYVDRSTSDVLVIEEIQRPQEGPLLQTLEGKTTGLYVVKTATAKYGLNLDDKYIIRDGTSSSHALRQDRQVIDLIDVRACKVGKPMVLRLDLHDDAPGYEFTDRTTSPVEFIHDWSGNE